MGGHRQRPITYLMSTERDAPAGAVESTATQKPSLTPPPRVQPERVEAPPLTPPPRLTLPQPSGPNRAVADSREGTSTRSWATWLTLAFFGVLMLAAIAVFVVLPDWVRDRQEASQGEIAGGSEAGGPTAIERTAESREMLSAAEDLPTAEPEPTLLEESAPNNAEPLDTELPAAPRVEPPPPAAVTRAAAAPKSEPAPPDPRDRRDAGKAPGAFERAMSEGLAALDGGDYATAREAFGRAAALRPGSSQSADGLARAEAGARLAEINSLREAARTLEEQEDWHGARQRYEAVLEIDPAIGFAIDGRARSSLRAELSDRMAFHLSHRGRLSSDEVLQEASGLLEQASVLEAGPKLQQQRQQLAQAIEAFSTPVTATLESDQLTDVVIYKVGRLGTFSRHALDLRPGTYTVVGSRNGFRDVRRKLVIEPGRSPQPLTIRCEEKI